MKKQRNATDHLTFPSGRTIKRCKEDAKKLRKQSKGTEHYLSYSKALDVIAKQNGKDMPWDKAVSSIISEQTNDTTSDIQLFNWLAGQVKNQQSHYKKQVHQKFEYNGKLIMPDGEGGYVEMKPHHGHPKALIITDQVAKLIEADIEALGGLKNMKGYDEGNIQLLYEKPGSQCHLAHEFHLDSDGTIHYYCRSLPWNGYEAELHARGYELTRSGYGAGPVDNALHWTGFCLFHDILVPKVA